MKTQIIQIGNSDNKLSQNEWAQFVVEMNALILKRSKAIHFAGGSPTEAPWQNYCWVFEPKFPDCPFNEEIITIRAKYQQESVAVTFGATVFI